MQDIYWLSSQSERAKNNIHCFSGTTAFTLEPIKLEKIITEMKTKLEAIEQELKKLSKKEEKGCLVVAAQFWMPSPL